MVTNDPDTGVNTAMGDDADTWLLRYDQPGGKVLDLVTLPVGSTCQSRDAMFTGTQDQCNAQIAALGLTPLNAPLPANWQAQVVAMGKLAQPLLPAGGLADLAAALAACQTVPGQFWVVQKMVFGLGITQAQIDAAVAAG
jgi:hypothetical protein